MSCCFRFNIRLEDIDIKIVEFSKNGDVVSVFNSNNVARWAGGVYIVNGVTGKREMSLVLKNNDAEKCGIPSANV